MHVAVTFLKCAGARIAARFHLEWQDEDEEPLHWCFHVFACSVFWLVLSADNWVGGGGLGVLPINQKKARRKDKKPGATLFSFSNPVCKKKNVCKKMCDVMLLILCIVVVKSSNLSVKTAEEQTQIYETLKTSGPLTSPPPAPRIWLPAGSGPCAMFRD